MRYRTLTPLALAAALALSACDDLNLVDPSVRAPTDAPRFSAGIVEPDPVPRLYANGEHWLGWAPRRSFTTINPAVGYPDSVDAYHLIGDSEWAMYNAFYDGAVDDSLKTWAQDSRLNLNPNFVASILAIESGFDPDVYEPGGSTYGYAQMGPSADGGLIEHINHHTAFAWMKPQVHPDYSSTNGYARYPNEPYDSAGLSRWYFSDPLKTTRALVYHLKHLENIWLGTHKVSWDPNRAWWRDTASINAYPAFAADTSYAELYVRVYGRGPTPDELLDLVAASYNRGYPWVEKMLIQYGTGWTQQLKAAMKDGPCLKEGERNEADKQREAGCYLDRARHYTVLFQNAAVAVSTPHEVLDDFDQGADQRWFAYTGPGSAVSVSVPLATEAHRGTAVDEGNGLRVDYSIASGSWGGVGTWYSSPQDWKTRTAIGATEGVGFWYYGNGRDQNSGSGVVVTVELQDNRSSDPALQGTDTAERWVFSFRDNFIGWRYIDVPWSKFRRGDWQPAGAPNDGLTLTQVWGIVFAPQSGTKWFRLDQLRLTQDRPWT